jgi:hypothetical protein
MGKKPGRTGHTATPEGAVPRHSSRESKIVETGLTTGQRRDSYTLREMQLENTFSPEIECLEIVEPLQRCISTT